MGGPVEHKQVIPAREVGGRWVWGSVADHNGAVDSTMKPFAR